MFTVSSPPSPYAQAVGSVLELADTESASSILVAPGRGAIVTSFRVSDRELFFLDAATLADPSKNVRGGNPILFPSPGKLAGDAWTRDGRKGSLKQLGFARNLPWSVVATGTSDAAAITLALVSGPATRAEYPWDFHAEFTFSLRGACLRIEQRIENLATSPMPFGIGFHPYFAVEDKGGARIATRATRAFDNVSKRVGPFTGFTLTEPEVDLRLIDHGGSAIALHLADGARIDLRGSEEFATWVVWTLGGKDFVCVEPWTCPGNALNTGESLMTLAPGASRTTWIEIALAI